MTDRPLDGREGLLPARTATLVFLSFALAYFLSALVRAITATLSPTLSAEVELGRERDTGQAGSERELGLGLWHAWLDPAREGWGLASSIELEWARATGSPWQRPAMNAVLAASLPLRDQLGKA